MYNIQRAVDKCIIKIFGDNMTTRKTIKISLYTFNDKRFYKLY